MSQSNNVPAVGSHFISLNTAISMTGKYRADKDKVIDSSYLGKDILPLSETFNMDDFIKLTETTNAAGIRLYYSMDQELKIHAIFVAVNDKNEDILPDDLNEKSMDADKVIIEAGQRCPTICPPSSALN